MIINKNPETLKQVVENLRIKYKGNPFAQTTMLAISDQIEHALVQYDEEDIENERFLTPFVAEAGSDKTLQLFIGDTIYIELRFNTVVPGMFQEIGEIECIFVLKADSH